jgi:hypothetical protein
LWHISNGHLLVSDQNTQVGRATAPRAPPRRERSTGRWQKAKGKRRTGTLAKGAQISLNNLEGFGTTSKSV